ncbi:MAG: metalloenzyme, partial [bacterium]
FCLFEFILLDVIGHQQDMVWAESELKKLNHFLNTVLNQIDLDHHLVLVTSDHGNFEDLSISTHTHNLVPTILWGKDRNKIAKKIKRIEDVPRAILSYIQEM